MLWYLGRRKFREHKVDLQKRKALRIAAPAVLYIYVLYTLPICHLRMRRFMCTTDDDPRFTREPFLVLEIVCSFHGAFLMLIVHAIK